MSKYSALAQNGSLQMQSDFMRENFKKFLLKHEGARIEFVPVLPESGKQRAYFEGAVVPLVAFFQEGMDHRINADCLKVRNWLKIEFNGELVALSGKVHRVAKSTKNELNSGFLERVTDWLAENYGIDPLKVLNPKDYQKWRDEIYPWGGPEDYISYLVEINILKKP